MATSERRDRDRRAYVYLQVPQSLEIVTAGYSSGIGANLYCPFDTTPPRIIKSDRRTSCASLQFVRK